MRIQDTSAKRELSHVALELTEEEAKELRDTLDTLLSDTSSRHEHVSAEEYDRELTVWVTRGAAT